jgi:hypothetical protein
MLENDSRRSIESKRPDDSDPTEVVPQNIGVFEDLSDADYAVPERVPPKPCKERIPKYTHNNNYQELNEPLAIKAHCNPHCRQTKNYAQGCRSRSIFRAMVTNWDNEAPLML